MGSVSSTETGFHRETVPLPNPRSEFIVKLFLVFRKDLSSFYGRDPGIIHEVIPS